MKKLDTADWIVLGCGAAALVSLTCFLILAVSLFVSYASALTIVGLCMIAVGSAGIVFEIVRNYR